MGLQGKELDRIFKEEGVIDELSDNESRGDAAKSVDGVDEVIGHMQSRDGENLGELVVVSKSLNKHKTKGKLIPCKPT